MSALRVPTPFLVLLGAIALLVAIPEEPIYVILCWIATLLFSWMAVVAAMRRAFGSMAVYLLMAILWNPWWYVPMPQIAWSACNLLVIAFLWRKGVAISGRALVVERKRTAGAKPPKTAVAHNEIPQRSIAQLEQAADAGDKRAQYELAGRLSRGRDIAKDQAKAQGWYEKAARQGYHKAQFRLGQIFQEQGDLATARKWYKRAAEQNNTAAKDALLALGSALSDGS